MTRPVRWLCFVVLVLGWSTMSDGQRGRALACFAVIAGREATEDGSVLVGHNEQDTGVRVLSFCKVPRRTHAEGETVRLHRGGTLPEVGQTAAYLWSQCPKEEFGNSYLNEHGVCVVSNRCETRQDEYDGLVKQGEISDGGIGFRLRQLVAERAKTAREGVDLAGRLVERFGYVANGRTYTIADPREAWLFAVIGGRQWVARRVPDDAVVLLPNVHVIRQIDLTDKANCLGSAGVIDYAVKRGWYDPTRDGPF
ncbi:MAG: C69 family dipeptidase, partial [Pirellulales bacterium]|nr:C69 family dipeptidase [Pirellulales bacterium]